MLSLLELKTLLDGANLKNKCTVTNTNEFLLFVDSTAMDRQNSYNSLTVDARFWIDYSSATNKFILQVNYFSNIGETKGNPITLEQFINVTSASNNAAVYGTNNQNNAYITWEPISTGNNTFVINCPPGIGGIDSYLNRRLSAITKIA